MSRLLTISQTTNFLQTHDNYLILNHRRPDGDAVGSAAALCQCLRCAGKQAYVWKNEQTAPKFQPFLTGLETLTFPNAATIVSVDTASESMFPLNALELSDKVQLAIDHHGSNTHYAEFSCVDPAAAACAEVLFGILSPIGIPKKAAEALYLGLSTDTGCFQFSNVTAGTLRTAAALKDLGADTFSINRKFFDTKSMARLQIEGMLTQTVHFYANGCVAVCSLPDKEIERFSATEDDVEGLSGFPRQIEGVEIGVMLRDAKEGGCKISVRTGEAYDANHICAAFGGGGHARAAGAVYAGSMQKTEKAVLSIIKELLGNINA